MRIFYNKSKEVFFCLCDKDERDIPKEAGFKIDPKTKKWSTKDIAIASKLMGYAFGETKRTLQHHVHTIRMAVRTSQKTSSKIEIPSPEGCEYLPYQKAGVEFSSKRPNTLNADPPGLGKTIQAIGHINFCLGKTAKILIICPATLKLNWKEELEKWLVKKMKIQVVMGGKSKISKGANINIINYEMLKKHNKAIKSRIWDLLIIDEAHNLRNETAQRTQYAFGNDKRGRGKKYPIKAKSKLFLTGTPIENRVTDLYPLLKALEVPFVDDFKSFASRYTNPSFNGFGYVYKGGRNLEELQLKLRETVMVRRSKEEVLKELPAKRRQIIKLSTEGISCIKEDKAKLGVYLKQKKKLEEKIERLSPDEKAYAKAVSELNKFEFTSMGELAGIRHQTALAKLPQVIEHCKDMLEETDKIIVFAHHVDVIKKLQEALKGFNPIILYGDVKNEDRQGLVKKFQTNPKHRVFIGGLKAAKEGITLTAANIVIFAELDWSPSTLRQAEDRAHRIGQRDFVLIHHLVVDGSIDAMIAQNVLEKQENIDKALDQKIA